MNFFEHQQQARINTRKLVVYLTLAIVSLLALTHGVVYIAMKYAEQQSVAYDSYAIPPYTIKEYLASDIFLLVTIAIVGVVFLGSLYKWTQLKVGGRVVAEHLGGVPVSMNTSNFLEKRLLNVVQEMAIASGMPVPPVYILEEQSINAFAAGHTPADAVIGITRGALQQFNREQLQGVIAHEFSHIFHGDSKINLNIMALLHGILLLGLIGYYVLRGSAYSRNKNAGGIMAVGIGLIILGYGGVFFGNLIKASVSRQREFLADASAVQYTRNPQGIADALKVIGYSSSAHANDMQNAHSEEVSHMMFSEAHHYFMQMWATHPPLQKRIARVEPNWDGHFLAPKPQHAVPGNAGMKKTGQKQSSSETNQQRAEQIVKATAILGAISGIGQVDGAQLGYAHELMQSIPADLINTTTNISGAQDILLAMVLLQSQTASDDTQQGINALRAEYQTQIDMLMPCPDHLRLPIVDLCIATLKQTDKEVNSAFLDKLDGFIALDKRTSLFEWCLRHIIKNQLQAFYDGPQFILRHVGLRRVMEDISLVLSLLVQLDDGPDAQTIFNKVQQKFGLKGLRLFSASVANAEAFDTAVDNIVKLDPLKKPLVLKACAYVITHDDQVKVSELEILRALSAAWQCPMPPVAINN